MRIEIERKFLVRVDRLPNLVRGKKLIQVYLSNSPAVRVRIGERFSNLTIKYRKINFNEEYIFKIPLKDAKRLINQTNNKVEKTRYKLKLNGDVWEVDIFTGKNKGLVMAEIELKSVKSKFQKPLWVGKEVTEDLRYTNENLAKEPFSNWKQ